MNFQRWAIQMRDNKHYWASVSANPHLFATRAEARAARKNIDPEKTATKVVQVDVNLYPIETWR